MKQILLQDYVDFNLSSVKIGEDSLLISEEVWEINYTVLLFKDTPCYTAIIRRILRVTGHVEYTRNNLSPVLTAFKDWVETINNIRAYKVWFIA